MATVDFLQHARAAIQRATSDLEELKGELKDAPRMSRPHRLAIEDEILELTRRHSVLADRFNEMDNAGAADLPGLWRQFFVAYDDYLDAVRRTKCARAGEEYMDDLSVAAPAADETAKEG